jgi:ArsR family metal-binding transcriptional regulator
VYRGKIAPDYLKEIIKYLPQKGTGAWNSVVPGWALKKMARDKNLRPCLPLKPQENS